MITPITLDDIKAAADRKYGSYAILIGDHTVELRNVLRLSKAEREQFTKLQDTLGESDDQAQDMLDLLRVLCATEGQFKKLSSAIDGDLAVMATIFEGYTDATQAGEASPSQD